MELEINWDNSLSIFHAFTYAELNKNFNVLYEEFEDRCSSVRRCTNNPLLYLIRKNLIPTDEADDPEAEYATLDQQVIQMDMIVKSFNINDVKLENSGARARKDLANIDNAKLCDLAKIAFGKTRLYVHAKPSQHNRDGRQALKLIWSNQLGVHAIDERNTKNYKDIRALAYHREQKKGTIGKTMP